MKFASLILDKSVPEWRFNNIDYEALKRAIKVATTDGEDCRAMETLTGLFLEEFKNVNFFVSMKIKEMSSRLVSIESSILKLKSAERMSLNKFERNLRVFKHYLDVAKLELQKLSRFIILQKVATRKLFKKFMKHCKMDQESGVAYINYLQGCEEFADGFDGISFYNVDLDSYLLEVSLISEVLEELTMHLKSCRSGKYLPNTDKNEVEPLLEIVQTNSSLKKVTYAWEFDEIVMGKSNKLQQFILSFENIEEFKFLLIQKNFNLIDDEIISSTKDVMETTDSHSLRTMGSFQKLKKTNNLHSHSNSMGNLTALTSITPDKNTTLSSNRENLQTHCVFHFFDQNEENPAFLHDENLNQFPNIMLLAYDSKTVTHNLLMCHVGGLRDHLITSNISYEDVEEALDGNINIEKEFTKEHWNAAEKLAMDWLVKHKMKEVEKTISFKRSRFVKKKKAGTYFIAVDENFDCNGQNIQDAIISIHFVPKTHQNDFGFKSKTDSMVEKVSKALIENKCQCFPIPQNLTVWKIMFELSSSKMLYKYLLNYINDTLNNTNVSNNDFFAMGSYLTMDLCSSDYRNNRSGTSTANTEMTKVNRSRNHLIESQSHENKPIRYWNEFDDGEDFIDDSFFHDDHSFDVNSNGKNKHPKATSFVILDKEMVALIFGFMQKIKNLFSFNSRSEYPQLLSETFPNTSYMTNSQLPKMITSSASPEEVRQLMLINQKDIERSDAVYEFRHDQVLTLMYLTLLCASSITSGMSLGIVLSLFEGSIYDSDIEVNTLLTTIIIASLLISLFFNCISLLLIFNRFTLAPLWHYGVTFILFFIVTCTVCYGIIEIIF